MSGSAVRGLGTEGTDFGVNGVDRILEGDAPKREES